VIPRWFRREPAAARSRNGVSLVGVLARGMSLNAVALLANLISGVLIARTLGPSGRGEIAAVLMVALVPYLLTFGCQRAVAFHQAQHPEDAGRLVTTWLLLLAPFVAACILAVEALVPVLLAEQTASTQTIARIWIATSAVVILSRIPLGILQGDHDFGFYYLVGAAQPVLIAAAYVLLAVTASLSVATAVVASGLTFAMGTLGAFARVVRRHAPRRPARGLARSTGAYAVRAQFGDMGSGVNARLDMLVMPALLSAASVGLYSVATNISWIVFSLVAAASVVVLPTTARRPGNAPETVAASLYLALIVASLLALAIGLVSRPAVTLLYGAEFDAALVPLRILLVGVVVYSAANVLVAGLYGANRPFWAASTEVAGALVTVGGLLLVLPSRGIVGAAAVSLLSYSTVLVGAALLYRYLCAGSWGRLRPRRDLMRRLREPVPSHATDQNEHDRAPALREALA
jgi:O-antigen/teichoic acid export membrane protein